MRKHATPIGLPALLLALALAGCAGQAKQPAPLASAPAAAAESVPAPTPEPRPSLYLLGDSNSTGWYSGGFSTDRKSVV